MSDEYLLSLIKRIKVFFITMDIQKKIAPYGGVLEAGIKEGEELTISLHSLGGLTIDDLKKK